MEELAQDDGTAKSIQAIAHLLINLMGYHSTFREVDALKVSLPKLPLFVHACKPSALHPYVFYCPNVMPLQCIHMGRSTHPDTCSDPQGICSKTVVIPDSETGPCEADRRLLTLLAEVLFLENSRPVHRQLLSGLQRLPAKRFAVFQDAILEKVLAGKD